MLYTKAKVGVVASTMKVMELTFTVKSVDEKPYKRTPYPPFMTSTLQQEAGLAVLYGNLCEQGAIIKPSAASPHLSGATAGYLWGFLVAAVVVGRGSAGARRRGQGSGPRQCREGTSDWTLGAAAGYIPCSMGRRLGAAFHTLC